MHAELRREMDETGKLVNIATNRKQVAQLSQRDRTAGWVSYGQKWKSGIGRQYFTDIGLPSTTIT